MKTLLLYLSAGFFVLAGLNHFRDPDFYLRMMPPYLPYHEVLNWISGIFEVILGVLLLPKGTRVFAAYGLILLLLAIFPANVQMLLNQLSGIDDYGVPIWALWLRLPMQIGFLAWVWCLRKIK